MSRRFLRLTGLLLVLFVIGWGEVLYASEGGKEALVMQLQQSGGGSVVVEYHAITGKVRAIGTVPGAPINAMGKAFGTSGEGAARSFLGTYGPLFGIMDQASEMSVMKSRDAEGGRSFVRFQQQHNGIPVIAGEIVVQMDSGMNVLSAHGETSPDIALDTTPSVSADAAAETALNAAAKWYKVNTDSLSVSKPELWVYNPALLGHNENTNRLVWRMNVEDADGAIRELVLVDAHTDGIALHFNQRADAKYRKIYNNNNNPALGLPGNGPVRIEGQAASTVNDVNKAYDYLGDTYDFFFTNFGRDSIDGAGMQLIATVRYCDPQATCPYANAFWNGTQMVFGATYANGDDVVGHELTHGVTENEAGLFYYMQSGAINESLSDIFGEFIDLTNGKGNDAASVRWLMGEDLPIGAIRSMKNPPLYNNPDRMTSLLYACGADDQGGVHSNSGIGNKAAFLMADGGTFNGQTVTALGIPKTAKIFYDVQTNFLTSGSDYADLGTMLVQACNGLVGTAGITVADCQQVSKAVLATEMAKQPTQCAAPEAIVCAAGTTPSNIFFDNMENTSSGNWTVTSTGADNWQYTTGYAASGIRSLYGPNLSYAAKISLISKGIPIPAGNPAFMHFKHAFSFETGISGQTYDGGILEYSTNNGSTWVDAGSLILNNGYNGVISPDYDNPLAGRNAFVNMSNGYMSSRLNLSSLAGKTVKFRFTVGSDGIFQDMGWLLDDMRVYTCVPAAPSNVIATSNTANRVDLTWSDNSSNENSFKIFRKTGTGTFTLLTTTAAGVTTYSDTTATGNDATNSYSYYIKACKSSICSASSKTAVVPFKPAAPKATAVAGKITISWTDKSTNESGFEVYRKPGTCSAAGTWTKITTTAANVPQYVNTGLTSGTTFSYKVRSYAKSAAPVAYGYSMYSACVNATAK